MISLVLVLVFCRPKSHQYFAGCMERMCRSPKRSTARNGTRTRWHSARTIAFVTDAHLPIWITSRVQSTTSTSQVSITLFYDLVVVFGICTNCILAINYCKSDYYFINGSIRLNNNNY